jgi:hypothetical protein
LSKKGKIHVSSRDSLEDKNGEHAQELAKGKETISSIKGSIDALQDSYDVLQKTHL